MIGEAPVSAAPSSTDSPTPPAPMISTPPAAAAVGAHHVEHGADAGDDGASGQRGYPRRGPGRDLTTDSCATTQYSAKQDTPRK